MYVAVCDMIHSCCIKLQNHYFYKLWTLGIEITAVSQQNPSTETNLPGDDFPPLITVMLGTGKGIVDASLPATS